MNNIVNYTTFETSMLLKQLGFNMLSDKSYQKVFYKDTLSYNNENLEYLTDDEILTANQVDYVDKSVNGVVYKIEICDDDNITNTHIKYLQDLRGDKNLIYCTANVFANVIDWLWDIYAIYPEISLYKDMKSNEIVWSFTIYELENNNIVKQDWVYGFIHRYEALDAAIDKICRRLLKMKEK